jgi:hypothetical protein
MSFHVEFSQQNKILRVSWQGTVTDQEMRNYYTTVTSAMSSVGPCSLICDFSGITKLQVSSNIVKELAAKPSFIAEGFKHVIVAPQEHVYGLVRMYEALTHRNNVVAVRTIGEAYRNLALINPNFSPLGETA